MLFLPPNPALLAQRGGRVEWLVKLVERLAAGDRIAWTFLIAFPGVVVLGALVGTWWARRKKKLDALDPAQVVAAWQKQRVLCAHAELPFLGGIGVALILVAYAMLEDHVPLGIWVVGFVGFAAMFVGMVIVMANGRCPACGRGISIWHRNLTFCSKCGARFTETEPPRQGDSGAAPNDSAEGPGGPPV